MDFLNIFVEYAATGLEAAGIGIICLGVVYAAGCAAAAKRRGNENTFRVFRRVLGRGILLGLELLVAADIINTVAIEPSFRSVGVLAVIVLVRTFLSFTLEVEMTGQWPWKRSRKKTVQNS
jgi:uncharacterized membrane protein